MKQWPWSTIGSVLTAIGAALAIYWALQAKVGESVIRKDHADSAYKWSSELKAGEWHVRRVERYLKLDSAH